MIHYHVKGERVDRDDITHKNPRRRGKRFVENKPGHHVNGHRRNRFKSSKQRKSAIKVKLGVQ